MYTSIAIFPVWYEFSVISSSIRPSENLITFDHYVSRLDQGQQQSFAMLKTDRFLADADWSYAEKACCMVNPYAESDLEVYFLGDKTIYHIQNTSRYLRINEILNCWNHWTKKIVRQVKLNVSSLSRTQSRIRHICYVTARVQNVKPKW